MMWWMFFDTHRYLIIQYNFVSLEITYLTAGLFLFFGCFCFCNKCLDGQLRYRVTHIHPD